MDLGSLLQAGESSLCYVKSIKRPLGFAKKACGIGAVFPYTDGLSQRALKAVKIAKAPSNFSALALDTISLARSLYAPIIDTKKISKLALSILKRGCGMLKWLEKYHFITLESALLGRLEGIVIFRDLTEDSMRLWKDLGAAATPVDRNRVIASISNVLKSSLLFYAHLSDDKRVKKVAKGIDVLSDLHEASARLWQDLGPDVPVDRDLVLSISMFVKSSLSIYSYLTDDKSVKFVIKGIGLMNDGYCLYQQCSTLKSQTITRIHICQILTSIALAALALYGIEKGYFQK